MNEVTIRDRMQPPGSRMVGVLSSLMILGVMAPGCASMRSLTARHSFGPKAPCVMPEHPTVTQVVEHVNQNVGKIDGWRASGVKIRAQSVPVPLSGNLVVEGNRRLRLEVTSALGKEVDLGSNDEVFWLWMKPRGEMPPAVYYASHENMDLARQQLPLPFEPEWLMEALGVVPIAGENMELETQPSVATLRLVSHHTLPDGQQIKKVIVVHGCNGSVMEHSTYDMHDQPIVRVVLQDYRPDVESGANLPHHVRIIWPQAEMSLALDMSHIDVNPSSVPPAVWQMPHVPGCAMVNLGDPRFANGPQYVSRPAAPSSPAGVSRTTPQTQVASGSDDLEDLFLMPRREATPSPPPANTAKVRWEEPMVEPGWDADVTTTSTTEEDDKAGRATLTLEPF